MQNHESSKHPTDNNNWDMSDVKFTSDDNIADASETLSDSSSCPENLSQHAESLDILESDPVEIAVADAKHWGKAYNDLEEQFMSYREQVDLDNPDTREQYKVMLRRYEDEISHVWGYMEDATATAQAHGQLVDPYSRSAAQGINISSGEERATVEVSSSIFYAERMHALQDAIRDDASLSPEQTDDYGRLLRSTWHKVLERIEANQDIAERRKDPEAHFYYCNELHDNLIRHLNQMNDLAKTYHLEPFTPRNFITNDRNYSARRDHNGDYHARVETDRSIVDYYFRQVFSSEYTKIEYKTSRDLGLTA